MQVLKISASGMVCHSLPIECNLDLSLLVSIFINEQFHNLKYKVTEILIKIYSSRKHHYSKQVK